MIIKEQINKYLVLLSEKSELDNSYLAKLVMQYYQSLVACLTLNKQQPYDDTVKTAVNEMVGCLISDNKAFYDRIITDELCGYIDSLIDLTGIL